MLNLVPDADGLNDRQLFDFPPERELLLDDLVVPMPPDTPDLLQTIVAVYNNHHVNQVYTLEGGAYAAYRGSYKSRNAEMRNGKCRNHTYQPSRNHGITPYFDHAIPSSR